MLYDRPYSTTFVQDKGPSLTVMLIIANAAAFLVCGVMQTLAPRLPIDAYLGLSLDGLRHGFFWQLFTFQFLHGGWLHLGLNMIGLFVFGRVLERVLGPKKYLALYLLSGVAGGLFHVLGSLWFPGHFGSVIFAGHVIHLPVVGASAGLFGLIAAFAALFPRQRLTVLVFFLLPVTVTAETLALVSAGVAVLGVWLATGNVAHGAHLGGMVGGYVLAKLLVAAPNLWDTRRSWPGPRELY